MRRIAQRLVPLAAFALCAVLCAAHSRSILVWWAMRLAHGAPLRTCQLAVTTLERAGDEGVAPLLILATNLRPLPAGGSGQYDDLVPPDSVCDLALDALRRLRSASPAPRTLEWNASPELPTYQDALTAYRLRELDLSLAWWAKRHRD